MENRAEYKTDQEPQCCDTEPTEEEMHEFVRAVEYYLYLKYDESPQACLDSALRAVEKAFCKVAPNSLVTAIFQSWQFEVEMDPMVALSVPSIRRYVGGL